VAKVFVEPVGLTLEAASEETLFEALVRAGVPVPTDCGGRGTCAKCLVRLGGGELSDPTEVELKRLSARLRADGWRLACQARPASARISIEVRETGGQRQILTASRLHHGAAHPAVTKELVTLAAPALDDPRSDMERLRVVYPGAEIPLAALRLLPVAVRASGWRALVTRYGRRVVDIEAGDTPCEAYGAAVDVGTSKIIVYLFDLLEGRLIDQEAVENPQMRYGEDVISRITRAGEGALPELTRAAREGINDCLATLRSRQDVTARHIYDVTIVGNTTMHHLALGLSPQGLGAAPFAPVAAEPLELIGADLDLEVNPLAGVHAPPPITGFVGSDALAVVTATRLAARHLPSLAIDIGTNTEIALAVDGHVTVTSCASGPAFEGYQIRHGMKAGQGAIEKIAITPEGEPTDIATIGGGPPVGICGSGVVDLLAGLVRCGVVARSGRMQKHERVREGDDGLEYVVTEGPAGPLVFTQHDVRNLQLAKGAINTGWALLLERLGLQAADLDAVFVAGAFGNYLDLENALSLGLLPPVATERVAFVGNAAGVGAQMALIDVRARRRMAELRARIAFLDLATNKEFHKAFSERLVF
jgi:uncharacterized 2Fe-2S/4Fe-4S cluster protein (DUF4445 family)